MKKNQMKKTLLVIAISFVSASTHAATLYDSDGLTYKINGDIQGQLRQKAGNDQDMDLEFDDLEIKNYVSYELDRSMTAFGRIDFGFKDMANDVSDNEKDDGQAELEEAYFGMAFDSMTVSFGKRATAADEFGVIKTIENDVADDDRFDAVETSGDDVIHLETKLQNITLIAAYEMRAKGSEKANDSHFDLFVSTELNGLELGAAYQQFDAEGLRANGGDNGIDTYGLSIAYDFGQFEVAADYSASDADDETDSSNASQYNLATSFAASSNTEIAVGLTETDFDEQTGEEDFAEYYANVTYKFPAHSNVRVFGEIKNTDLDDSDLGYLAGMRIKF